MKVSGWTLTKVPRQENMPLWFHPALLEQSELLAQEKILGSQCAA
jgi:hypothetical protein